MADTSPPTQDRAPAPKPLRILIADDDPSMRKMLVKMSQLLGHDVRETGDGREALSLLEKYVPDVLLLDMMMPNLDGIETLSVISECAIPVRVIAMSGNYQTESIVALDLARKLGAARVLAKPFAFDDLATALREVVE